MQCPKCQKPLIRSTTLIAGAAVLCCKPCKRYQVEGTTQWVEGGQNAMDQLLALADRLEEERKIYDEMWNSDISDPRWTQIGW